MNESIHYKGVCRTATATPGLLITCVRYVSSVQLLGLGSNKIYKSLLIWIIYQFPLTPDNAQTVIPLFSHPIVDTILSSVCYLRNGLELTLLSDTKKFAPYPEVTVMCIGIRLDPLISFWAPSGFLRGPHN